MSDFSDIKLEEIEDKSFEPLADGVYKFRIDKSEMKTPRNGGSEFLALKLVVYEGDRMNTYFYSNLLINHTNDQARNIARARFKELCLAVGYSDPSKLIAQDFEGKLIMGRIKSSTKEKRNADGTTAQQIYQNLTSIGQVEKSALEAVDFETDDVPF